jgi:beta-barrel assembly-enhancing protease
MNKNFALRLVTIVMLAASMVLGPVRPSWAFLDMFAGDLSVEKERQIGEEFLLEVQQYLPVVEDPFVTSYYNHLGQKLVAQIGPQPFHYRFFIVVDPSMNAFAVPGGYIFMNTGLIRMAHREGEVVAVMAHEISHVYCRHMAKMMKKSRVASAATLIGALASVFLGGALAQPLLMGTMAASQSAMLKYSRDNEAEADALGFKWMVKAGYNPRDMVSIFSKMNKQRWLEGGKLPVYLSTHPDIDNRIVELAHQLSMHQTQLPPEKESPLFPYFQVKLASLCGNAGLLLRRMTQDGIRDPKNPVYKYGKALALAKLERGKETVEAFNQALRLDPSNKVIQRELAIFYFDHNQYSEATPILQRLAQRSPRDDVTLYYLGRIFQETKKPDMALTLFEKVHRLNPTFSEVNYYLGTIYGTQGKLGLAHYYLGLHSMRVKALSTAMYHFQKAMRDLSPGDPHYRDVQMQLARLKRMKVRVHY